MCVASEKVKAVSASKMNTNSQNSLDENISICLQIIKLHSVAITDKHMAHVSIQRN